MTGSCAHRHIMHNVNIVCPLLGTSSLDVASRFALPAGHSQSRVRLGVSRTPITRHNHHPHATQRNTLAFAAARHWHNC